jgi:branched-subunit amino acid transport protein
MSTAAAISAVVAVGLVTYASRAGLIVFLADRPVPAEATRALRYVGPAVLSALTVNLIASLLAGMATLWIVLALS